MGALLDRYASVCDRTPFFLTHKGKTTGCVETIRWTRTQVQVRGWCLLDNVSLGFAGRTAHPVHPWLHRPDLANMDDGLERAGFEVLMERPARNEALAISTGGDGNNQINIPAPSLGAEQRARLRALPKALGFAVGCRRDILRFLFAYDPGASVALREAFGLDVALRSGPSIPDDLFSISTRRPPDGGRTVVLVPVYNAFEQVTRLLKRLAQSVDIEHHILLIDDGSSDPRIVTLLAEFAADAPNRSLEKLPGNIGFVGAVNHGLSLARDLGHHVILLNTDTLPPMEWASRLIRPILDDRGIASVTPASNTAEIASIPTQADQVQLTTELVDVVDATARRLNPEHSVVEIPTGIGFAMAMNRRFLDRVGGFDPVFGRGYGEEVDWCQRARHSGGRNVLATNLFVGHEGGASFGSAERKVRVQAAGEIISTRYPHYDQEVQNWARVAPHGAARIALALAWLDAVSTTPVPVILGHALGGGAELALQREVQEILAAGAAGAVILRTGGTSPWRIEIEGAGFSLTARLQSRKMISALVKPLRQRKVIYSCGVGGRDPLDVPRTLLELSHGAEHEIHLRLHDYYPISPSYCLLDSKGEYRGLPTTGNTDSAHNRPVSLKTWRTAWSEVIDRTVSITTFSKASANLLAAAYPAAAMKTDLAPHPTPKLMPGPVRPGGRAIGVLGGINQSKGASVLTALAHQIATKGNKRKIVLVGELDPNFRLSRPHRVLGQYERSEITELARWNEIGLWLIPSIWPETYSFTTREALATGLPVLTFDLGAQAEAAHAAPNGHVIATDPGDTASLLEQIEAIFADGQSVHPQTVTMSRLAP